MTTKFKYFLLYFCALYVFVDVSIMLLTHYGLTTKDENCRNKVMEKYYAKHGSLENFSKRSAMSNYILKNGSLDGFEWK